VRDALDHHGAIGSVISAGGNALVASLVDKDLLADAEADQPGVLAEALHPSESNR
jgi:hypothetical protein